ncbi:NAD(+) diphosphatase [Rhodococcus sp. 27YEA15]|uniref:NAD(+) diphosphatase n=1 Tax=Rhodococcus sp. 27YEA15 TaxID=3156259 RepID=UPI003C7E0F4B
MYDFQLNETPLLSRSSVGRAEELRSDEAALEAGWGDAQLLRVNPSGQVVVDSDGNLVFGAATDLGPEPVSGAVFLGIRDGRHVWAHRVTVLAGRLSELRILGGTLGDADAGMLTGAVAILNWHDSAGFSAIDGAPSRPTMSGWSRISSTTGHEEFPRTDPAVICLVHDGGDRVLLARQPTWPERRFSILAGFVEAGESLETCVIREIKEEVGVDVHSVRYLGSQPWPFPRSLMLGFTAIGDPAAPLLFADGEIAEGFWFTRAEVRKALELGDWASDADTPLLLPGSVSIARGILESWAAVRA